MSNHRKNDLINYAKANTGYIIEDSFDSDFTLKPFITKALYSMSDNVFILNHFQEVSLHHSESALCYYHQSLVQNIKHFIKDSLILYQQLNSLYLQNT